MGAATSALVIAAALAPAAARADPCTGVTASGGRFATCFDLGNRLSITAGSNGLGIGGALRHDITFDDDPDLVWKMDHTVVDAAGFDDRVTGVIYRGRYIRHARDGHIVIPVGTPKKVFLPFDIGALAEIGTVDWRAQAMTTTIGVVRTAALVDFARSRTMRSMFAIGPVARWQIELERHPLAIAEHVVSPFTTGLANLHLESSNGIYAADVRIEAGTAWRQNTGWKPEARGEATLERIVLAINDRPIGLFLGIHYDTSQGEAIARVGARFVLFDRGDPRVSLDPLR